MICRLCGAKNTLKIMRLVNAPNNIQNLYSSEENAKKSRQDLDVMQCDRCGFVHIDPQLQDDYYDDYLMATTHSLQMQEYQRNQASELISKFELVGKKIKDVGCGDGSFMMHLKNFGANVTGLEPSNKFRAYAKQRGFVVESNYLTEDFIMAEAPYDAIVTRQVLEHIPDINSFISGMKKNLKLNGVGLIEVPSLEKAIVDKRYYDFFTDHVNYFSLNHLRLLLELNGLEVIDLYHGMNDEYNIAIFKKTEKLSFSALNSNIEKLGTQISELRSEATSKGADLVIWGAGGKGLSVLASAQIFDGVSLVDTDRAKVGMFTPVTGLKIQAPDSVSWSDVTAVLITAMAYHLEIIDTLRTKFGYTNDIYVLGDGIRKI